MIIPPIEETTNQTAAITPTAEVVPADYAKLGLLLIIGTIGSAVVLGLFKGGQESPFRVPNIGRAHYRQPRRGKAHYRRPRT